MPPVWKRIDLKETEEELMEMTRSEVTRDLDERQIRFCEHYVRNCNNVTAAYAAGFSGTSAHQMGWKLRQKYPVNRYIAWLKLRISKETHLKAMDFIDQYARIAFADMNDFVKIKNGRAKVVDSEMLDGQIIKSVKQGKDGVQIEFYDKLSALDKLARYLDFMPADWRQKIEERKLELMEQKLELEKNKAGFIDQEDMDDGFLEALRETAVQVWNDDLEEEAVGDEQES